MGKYTVLGYYGYITCVGYYFCFCHHLQEELINQFPKRGSTKVREMSLGDSRVNPRKYCGTY